MASWSGKRLDPWGESDGVGSDGGQYSHGCGAILARMQKSSGQALAVSCTYTLDFETVPTSASLVRNSLGPMGHGAQVGRWKFDRQLWSLSLISRKLRASSHVLLTVIESQRAMAVTS